MTEQNNTSQNNMDQDDINKVVRGYEQEAADLLKAFSDVSGLRITKDPNYGEMVLATSPENTDRFDLMTNEHLNSIFPTLVTLMDDADNLTQNLFLEIKCTPKSFEPLKATLVKISGANGSIKNIIRRSHKRLEEAGFNNGPSPI